MLLRLLPALAPDADVFLRVAGGRYSDAGANGVFMALGLGDVWPSIGGVELEVHSAGGFGRVAPMGAVDGFTANLGVVCCGWLFGVLDVAGLCWGTGGDCGGGVGAVDDLLLLLNDAGLGWRNAGAAKAAGDMDWD